MRSIETEGEAIWGLAQQLRDAPLRQPVEIIQHRHKTAMASEQLFQGLRLLHAGAGAAMRDEADTKQAQRIQHRMAQRQVDRTLDVVEVPGEFGPFAPAGL